MSRFRTLLLAACAAALFAVAPADAATFCVNAPGCAGTQVGSPQAALNAAALNGTPDAVQIGAKATPYASTFSYSDPERVTILGAGSTRTVIDIPAGSHAKLLGNSLSRLEGVRLRFGDGSARGLALGGIARRVNIVQTGSDPARTGLVLSDGGLFDEGSLSVAGAGVVSTADSGARIEDSTVRARIGLSNAGDADRLTASRLIVRTAERAIDTPGRLTLDNSVLDSRGDGVVAGPGSVVTGDHLTVVGHGPGIGGLIAATASAPADLRIRNSILMGFEQSLQRGEGSSASDLSVRWSAFRQPFILARGDGVLDLGVGNTLTLPQLVPPLGLVPSYRVLAPAATIDAADPQDAQALDLAGNPRRVDGDGAGGARSDMGAYEYGRQAPEAGIALKPAAPQPGDTVVISGGPSRDPDPGDGSRLAYSWRVDGAAAGNTKVLLRVFSSAGVHTLELRVTDPTGRISTATRKVKVGAPDAPGDPAGPSGPGGPGADRAAPVLSRLRAGARRLRFRLSERAQVRVLLRKRGSTRVKRLRLRGLAGANSALLSHRGLAAGRWLIRVRATDAAGNSSRAALVRLRVAAEGGALMRDGRKRGRVRS